MQLTDPVYGSFDVEDEVLVELIRSKPMERIKHVSQQGIPREFNFKGATNHGRYEHCVGVMLLLRRLNADMEEQISGLLHDVSHTAFSHTADMILGSYADQGLQDSIHEEYFRKGELPEILEKHGYDPKRISNEKLFGLLERDIPDICADRVDYSLRGRYYQGGMESRDIATHIIPYNNEMVLDSGKYAIEYGKLYMRMQRGEYGDVNNIAIRYAFATAIKAAFDAGAITKEDILYGTDELVVEKAENAGIEYVNKVFDALRRGEFSVIGKGSVHLKAKLRYVDPKFPDGNILRRATDLDPELKSLIDRSKEEDASGYNVSMKIGNIVLG
ncbi:HD domain-containing protein [mine drainage metagenome]|uniref:HD domain-containing protein n=1 Tax=mine drainage metagenome TaxID=410659 RepID=T1B366_9ZZZZ